MWKFTREKPISFCKLVKATKDVYKRQVHGPLAGAVGYGKADIAHPLEVLAGGFIDFEQHRGDKGQAGEEGAALSLIHI